MPTILRIDGYRFYWYSREDGEPMHIHVRRDSQKAKFWITPVQVASNQGFADHELNRIVAIIHTHRSLIEEAWREKDKSCGG